MRDKKETEKENLEEQKNCAKNLRADVEKAEHIEDEVWHIRDSYQRDESMILHSTAFRRLAGKTQVFNAGLGEDYRNRLTHSLDVVQIATLLSKYFGFNVELTRAIALGHDIGHTPFGHVGERTLNEIMNNCSVVNNYGIDIPAEDKGFKHNLQGVRILCDLEKTSPKYKGANLTCNTLWGISNHTAKEPEKCKKHVFVNGINWCLMKRDRKCFQCPNKNFQCTNFYNRYFTNEKMLPENAWTFEAFIVKIADDIAQRYHDIEDGIYFNIIDAEEFVKEFSEIFISNPKSSDLYFEVDKVKLEIIQTEIKDHSGFVIPLLENFVLEFYIKNYMLNVSEKLQNVINVYEIRSNNDFYEKKNKIWVKERDGEGIKKWMSFDDNFINFDERIKKFLKDSILNSRKAQLMDGKGAYIIRNLFEAYLSTPNQLPDHVIESFFLDCGHKQETGINKKRWIGERRALLGENKLEVNEEVCLCRNICDYISSMSDRHALRQYEKLYESTILT